MKIKNITFEELQELNKNKEFGIVVLGAGGNFKDWVVGIAKVLKDEKIAEGKDVFTDAAKLTGNKKGDNGRTDLVLLFNPKCKLNIEKLAIWRIKFGDVSWIEDFVVNYRKDYI